MEYADEKQRADHWTVAEARERSRESISRLLGNDPGARRHRFFKGLDDNRSLVGWVWIGPPPPVLRLESAQWLYQITVKEELRGRGLGRGLLAALESRLAEEGFNALHLNVFKWNVIARHLYDSLGYEVVLETSTETGMRKWLRDDHGPPRSGDA